MKNADHEAPLPRGLHHQGEETWLIQLSRDGHRLTRRFHGSKAAALRALDDAKVELGRKQEASKNSSSASSAPLPPDRRVDVPTLLAFLSDGGRYENHQLRNQSERTRRKLVSPIRYLIASDLGPLRLDDVSAAAINDYVSWRMKVGQLSFSTTKRGQPRRPRGTRVGAQSINKSLRVLSSALRFAQREGLLETMPYIEMLPETEAKRVHGPSLAEYQHVLLAAERLRPLAPWLPEVVKLVAEFGLRPGEVFSLPWSSVDWTHQGNGTLRGCVYVEEQKRSGFIPKMGKRRLVPMSPRGREVLQTLLDRVPAPTKDELVVPNHKGLPYIRLDVPGMKGGGAGIWKKLQALSGVHVTLYSLRHFFVEQSLSAGVPLHVVSRWAGHSKVELTSKTYGDYAPDNAAQWDWAGARERKNFISASSPASGSP